MLICQQMSCVVAMHRYTSTKPMVPTSSITHGDIEWGMTMQLGMEGARDSYRMGTRHHYLCGVVMLDIGWKTTINIGYGMKIMGLRCGDK